MAKITYKMLGAGLLGASVVSGASAQDATVASAGQTSLSDTFRITDRQFEIGCIRYKMVLEEFDKKHMNGAVPTGRYPEMAEAAFQHMVSQAYKKGDLFKDPVTGKPDENAVTFTGKDNEKITSLAVNGQTVVFERASLDIRSYDDQCTYLRPALDILGSQKVVPLYDLFDNAIIGAVAETRDPHSYYMTHKELNDLQDYVDGKHIGIGIHFALDEDGNAEIIEVDRWSPAERSGIKVGDRIMTINGEATAGHNYLQVSNMLSGELDRRLDMTIKRGNDEPFPLKMRAGYVPTITAKGGLVGTNNDVVHIKVKTFSGKTKTEITTDLDRILLKAEIDGREIREVIVDLRENPGGLTEAAIETSDLFLNNPAGKRLPMLVVGDSLDDPDAKTYYMDSYSRISKYQNLKVTVLANEGTGSAAEIVAAALQDYLGAKVIGIQTFGKGSSQDVLPKGFGALRITTDMIFPGKGLSTQGSGVVPHTLVQYNDFRDEEVAKATREKNLKNTLPATSPNRDGQVPEQVCSLKKEFAGVLARDLANTMPPELVTYRYSWNEHTRTIDRNRVADAEMACALVVIEGKTSSEYVEIKPYKKVSP